VKALGEVEKALGSRIDDLTGSASVVWFRVCQKKFDLHCRVLPKRTESEKSAE
jgi:hypothetical protein